MPKKRPPFWRTASLAEWRSGQRSSSGPVSTWMGDRLRAAIPSRYVINQLDQLSLASLRGRLIEYQLRLGKGGIVSSAGWQVTLCDPIWHVSSRSGVAVANCYTPFTFTLHYYFLNNSGFSKVKWLHLRWSEQTCKMFVSNFNMPEIV